MSVVLESRMLRDFLHRLVDNLINELEMKSTVEPVSAVVAVTRPETGKPRITLEPPDKKAPATKSAPSPPGKVGKVTMSCRIDCGRLAIAIAIPAGIAKRLNLKPHGKATADLHDGKVRVRASKEGSAVYLVGQEREGSGRVFFHVLASSFGISEKHAAEGCTFHYDLKDALAIEPPAWLKQTAPAMPPPKRGEQKPKDGTPVSCKKMAGTNPTIKCAACGKMATVECNRCPTLLCDDCWEPHVRTHWHTAVTSRAPTGHAAEKGEDHNESRNP